MSDQRLAEQVVEVWSDLALLERALEDSISTYPRTCAGAAAAQKSALVAVLACVKNAQDMKARQEDAFEKFHDDCYTDAINAR